MIYMISRWGIKGKIAKIKEKESFQRGFALALMFRRLSLMIFDWKSSMKEVKWFFSLQQAEHEKHKTNLPPLLISAPSALSRD